jgi:hypothetical protein
MKSNNIYKAKILNVFDSSSFCLLIDLGFDSFIIREVNLFGVKPLEIDNETKESLKSLLINKQVHIKSYKENDKYLVDISAEMLGSIINISSYFSSLGYVKKI